MIVSPAGRIIGHRSKVIDLPLQNICKSEPQVLLGPNRRIYGLTLTFMNVQDTFCTGKTMICDLCCCTRRLLRYLLRLPFFFSTVAICFCGSLEMTLVRMIFPDPKTKGLRRAQEQRLRSYSFCLLYTSPSPRDLSTSRMPSSA